MLLQCPVIRPAEILPEKHTYSQGTIFKADCKKMNTNTEAIPKRRPFGIALFLPNFFIPFSIQISFRRVCADAIFGIRVEWGVL